MRTRALRILCLSACFMSAALSGVLAQGPPPGGGGAPGGPGGPGGMPGGPGGRGAPMGPHGSNTNPASSGAPQKNALQFGPVGRWWDDKTVIKEIGLRKDQQKKMDQIFDANKPAILASYKAFQKAQANLETVNKDTNADKSTVFSAIDAVNTARSDLQKSTSAMLIEIRKEMDPEQITKLEKLE